VPDPSTWTHRRTLAAVLGAALVLTVSGCGGSEASSAPDAPAATTTTTTPPTLDTVSYTNEAREAKAKGGLPWFCQAQGLGGAMDHGHPGGIANNVYEGKKKGDLSADDCEKLATMFDSIIEQVKPYRTRGELKKTGGFTQSVQFVAGLGTHDVVRNRNGGFSTKVGEPPGPPMFLQYDGDGDDAPLAGMSWLTISGAAPPPGFPGDNDWWHTHSTLCYSGPGTVIGNEISDEQCKEIGGQNRQLPGVWMSHAWIVPGYEDRYDVFSGAYMCVKGTGKPPTADDPCHHDLSDPEHGGGTPMPGMDHSQPMPGMDHSGGSMPPMDHGHAAK
jgi:hypothetical protein